VYSFLTKTLEEKRKLTRARFTMAELRQPGTQFIISFVLLLLVFARSGCGTLASAVF
jgi:hypothetical protein